MSETQNSDRATGSGTIGSHLPSGRPIRPVTRRIVSDRDDPISTRSLPSEGSVGGSNPLWRAVRSRVRVSAALREGTLSSNRRSRMFEDERRFDDEGLTSDTLRGDINHQLAPGQYAEQWQSLAHLFDEHDDDNDSRGRRISTPKRRSKRSSVVVPSPLGARSAFPGPSSYSGTSSFKLRSRRSQDPQPDAPNQNGTVKSVKWQDAEHIANDSSLERMQSPAAGSSSIGAKQTPKSISEEPISMLSNDPEHTPLGEDPLLYANPDCLLESDTDTDTDLEDSTTDDGDDVDHTRPNGPGKGIGLAESSAAANIPTASAGTAKTSESPTSNSRMQLALARFTSALRSQVQQQLVFTPLRRNILKCALAYLIASLFTYSSTLSRWLATLLPDNDPDGDVPFSNLHMIATVAVYFHPAKTLGAMIEADIYALGAFLYAIGLGFGSMAAAVFLHETNRLIVSDIVSVLVFLGIGIALVGFAKIKVAKPQFNTACSLVSIIVFTVVVKEGSLHLGHFSFEKTFQVTLVVLVGSLISNLVCFNLWPQSATTNLQIDIVRNLRGFSTLLRVLTKTFLLEDPSEFHFKSDRIKRAIDDHHDSFTSLKKNLDEAKLESLFDMRMRGMGARYVEATDSLNRLAQHLAGLRSSCGLQHKIMMARKEAQRAARDSANSNATDSTVRRRRAEHRASTTLSDIFQDADEPDSNDSKRSSVAGPVVDIPASSATAFEDFVESVGPHMRSLVFSCCRTLRGLRSTFVAQDSGSVDLLRRMQENRSEYGTATSADLRGVTDEDRTRSESGTNPSGFVPGSSFDGLDTEITSALRRFQHEQTAAIKRIYTMEPKKLQDLGLGDDTDAPTSPPGLASNDPFEAVHRSLGMQRDDLLSTTANPDEEIFLIFFFVFNLEEFAKELEVLIEALEEIRQAEERIALARQTSWWKRLRLFFGTFGAMRSEYRGMLRHGRRRKTRLASAPKKITTPLDFPSNRRHAVNTGQTPSAQTWKDRLSQLVWSLGEFFRQPDTKFAIKAGAGSAILASPAFFQSTRHIFTKFQGQWALVSFMVVLSPTVGQSNHMSLHRILGTILGAVAAVTVYKLFPDNNVVMPVFGVLFSLPCFKYIVGKPQLASSGRFVLLTYNLTALYSYNLRKTEVEVDQIAIQRTISVVIGVLWATILNQLIWPFEARRQLALGVSDVLFKLAWLYQRLVLSYSEDPTKAMGTGSSTSAGGGEERGMQAEFDNELFADAGGDYGDYDTGYDEREDVDEETALLGSAATRRRDEFQAIELHLQVSLIKLEGLLAQTKHEPRLKGPFPVATYKSMLGCCQNMLDKLHSMRCVTGRQDWYRHVRRDFVIPVNAERREMVGNILLFFYTLGSAFHLKSPVPPYFPPADECRTRLLDKIRQLPVVKRRAVRGSSAYLLFYSYALAMKDVIEQLEELGRLTQQNFGVWGGSVQDFESHFVASPDSANPTPAASKRPSRSNLRR
ncbi:hypothetical protein BCV70DRAFT_160354 [Testicularia cyperi]|uniref:Uncharacterized protein n=1 Tax=Testicularia cyperi TaxID=1882483 RepID=A0A317XR22_9BASI|nr:hypothetical protein BCV70DRAFT_160354 [Testicularia cyperi]